MPNIIIATSFYPLSNYANQYPAPPFQHPSLLSPLILVTVVPLSFRYTTLYHPNRFSLFTSTYDQCQLESHFFCFSNYIRHLIQLLKIFSFSNSPFLVILFAYGPKIHFNIFHSKIRSLFCSDFQCSHFTFIHYHRMDESATQLYFEVLQYASCIFYCFNNLFNP